MLALYEKLFLLSIHEEKGTLIGSTVERLKLGLPGAALAQLALAKKIETTDNHRLRVVNTEPVGDDFIDDILGEVKASEKERKFGTWLNGLPQKPEKLRKQITDRLVLKKIVTQDDDHFVWVIPSPLHPELNASVKFGLVQDLRGIVLAQKEHSSSDLALLGLLRACGLLELVFLRDERRFASRHVNELLVGAAMKDPVALTLQEIENALSVIVEDD